MHARWIEAMDYFNITQEEREPFYKWYCETYPQGDQALSVAYKEWKETNV